MNRVFHDQMGELAAQKHVQFILSVEKKKDSLEAVAMEHPRMNGEYWYLTTLDLLGKLQAVDVDEVVSWVLQCQHDSGGFGGNIGHDPYVQYTLSAVQVLVLFNKIDVLDADKVASYVATLQNEDGSFSGDGVEKAVNYTVSCKNHDGGFGCTPGGESHAGQNLVLMDIENGGISDRPDDVVDVYHTYFGVAVDARLELLSFELHPEELLGTAYDWDKISNDYMR